MIVVEDERKNKFGGYLSSQIQKVETWLKDSNAFLFSLKSNGRVKGMRKFEIKDSQYAFYLPNKSKEVLFGFGGSWSGYDLCVNKEDKKSTSRCSQHNSCFNYHGLSNVLCGKENFIPQRIVVIQMK